MSRSTFGKHDIKHNELKFYIHKIIFIAFSRIIYGHNKKKNSKLNILVYLKKNRKKNITKKELKTPLYCNYHNKMYYKKNVITLIKILNSNFLKFNQHTCTKN